MLSLLIKDNELVINDVDKSQILTILEWFSSDNIENIKYVMGIDKPITADELYEKYLEVLINAHEFFLGINVNEKLVGFIKGRADYKDEGEIWIMSMLIDMPYQNRGIGRRVINLVINEFKQKLGIKKFFTCLVNDNAGGRQFWEKNNFNEYRSTKDFFTINNKSYDLIIMHRQE